MKRHLTQEAIQMANKPMKKCLPSLATREMKIKTTQRFHYTHMCMAKIKKNDNAKCQWGCRETGHIPDGNAKWSTHTGNQCDSFFKKLSVQPLYNPEIAWQTFIYLSSQINKNVRRYWGGREVGVAIFWILTLSRSVSWLWCCIMGLQVATIGGAE